MDANVKIDIRPVLSDDHGADACAAPHRLHARVVGQGRYVANTFRARSTFELSGPDHYVAAGDADAVAREMRSFITGVRTSSSPMLIAF